MTRTEVLRGKWLSTVLGLSLLCGSGWVHAESWGLTELMQTLARQKVAKATFTEKKYIAVVDRPLESSGELSFTAPDKLEKRTLSPKPETLLLDGDQLSIEQAGRRRNTINIQSHPEVAAFIESIRGTLAGDVVALQRYYTLDFSGRAEAWKLVLVPVQPAMRKVMSRIRVDGAGEALTRIVFEQADGDRSEMHIQRMKTP